MPSIPRPYELVNGIRDSAEVERWLGVQAAVRGSIEARSITAEMIEVGTITGTEIANTTITGGKIATGTITASKLNVTTLSAITENVGDLRAGTISMGSGGNIHIGNLYVDASGFYVYGSDTAYRFRSAFAPAGRDIGWIRSFYGGGPNGSSELASFWDPSTQGSGATAGIDVYSTDNLPAADAPVGYLFCTGDGAVFASDSNITVSDRRLKEEIRDVDDPLEVIRNLRPRRYMRKASGAADAGFVAQELTEALPDLVHENPKKPGHLGIKYDGLHAYTVGAIQELADRVAELEKR